MEGEPPFAIALSFTYYFGSRVIVTLHTVYVDFVATDDSRHSMTLSHPYSCCGPRVATNTRAVLLARIEE